MEIFHAFGVDWRLLLIQAVNFGVLLVALWAFLYKPLMRVLEERSQKMQKAVLDADAAAQKLEDAEGEKRALLARAMKEADAASERARKDLEAKEKEATAQADAKVARMLKDAEKESAEMKAQALAGAKEELARMIVLGAEKALAKEK
jgi:F-type H+-transporting ATPase subunit b